jgi:hypothetical protein
MKVEEQRRLVALKKCYGKICRQGPAFALARDARSRLRKWTALMWIPEPVLKYVGELALRAVRALPSGAKAEQYLRALGLKVRAEATREPLFLLFTVALGAIIYFVLRPGDFPSPSHTCYVIEDSLKQFGGLDGNELRFDRSRERPCESGKVVAAEFYNWYPTEFEPHKFTNAITGNIFLKGSTTIAPNASDKWLERTLFGEINNFQHGIENDMDGEASFLPNGCGFDHKNEALRKTAILQRGTIIYSSRRSDEKLPRDKWLECNWHADEPGYPDCHWLRYEFFLPEGNPENWCKTHSFFDKFLLKGTYKKRFVDDASENVLIKAAQNRTVGETKEDVPQDVWENAAKDLPRLCMRDVEKWINSDQKPEMTAGPWREFSRISAVWCDY